MHLGKHFATCRSLYRGATTSSSSSSSTTTTTARAAATATAAATKISFVSSYNATTLVTSSYQKQQRHSFTALF